MQLKERLCKEKLVLLFSAYERMKKLFLETHETCAVELISLVPLNTFFICSTIKSENV